MNSIMDLLEILNSSTKPAVTSNTYLALSPETPFSLHVTTSIVVKHGGIFFQYE